MTAKLSRQFHPLRFQRWAFSDLNPWLRWLEPAAKVVKAQRQPVDSTAPARKVEAMASEAISASLDYYRAIRDAMSEAMFFQTYGNVFSMYLADKREADEREGVAEPRELPFVKEALASIEEGGYTEALARVGALLARRGAPLPLDRLAMRKELIAEYRELLPALEPHEWRRVRGEQELIVRYEPERALATLSILLRDPADREKLITLARRLLADERLQRNKPSSEQIAMLTNIGETLHVEPLRRRRTKASTKPATKSARKPAGRRQRVTA